MIFEDDDDANEDDFDLTSLQVAERLEGAPGCAQFPNAFRDLHSQVQGQLASLSRWAVEEGGRGGGGGGGKYGRNFGFHN